MKTEHLHAEQRIHTACLSSFALSGLSNSFCCLSRFPHSLLLLFSSCTPSLYQYVSLSFVYMPFSFFFPFSKLITERVLMGNPVEKKSILSHTKSRFLLSCHFCCFSFSLSPAAILVSSSTLVFRVSWNTVVDFYEVLFHWYLID